MAQLAPSENKQPLLARKVLVLDGPPASGKGSMAQKLEQLYGCIHLSTGDIFRDHVSRNTEIGRQVKKYIDMKSFVPDALVVNLVLDRISQPDCQQYGCILDGFPRTAAQYAALQKANITIDRVIRIQCPDDVLLRRAKGRRIDPQTKRIYHKDYVRPPKNIEHRLIKRNMDNNIQTRLTVYRAQHRRFKFDECINVNGNKGIDAVWNDIHRIIKEDFAAAAADNNAQMHATADVKPGACTICLDRASDFIIVPCGHQCGCESCLKELKQRGQKCPMCRGNIELIQKVYANYEATINIAQDAQAAAPRGVPERQEIANTEEDIFGAEQMEEDEKWPQDEIDDEMEEKKANDGNISIQIAPIDSDSDAANVKNVVLEVTVAQHTRAAVDICAVLDVSGSMCSSAAVQEDDGSIKKDDGLSILDCVKHSVKTVMHCLKADDRLSIVPFSSDACIHHPLSFMSAEGIKKAAAALEQLQPGGTTNLWEGLRMGMESLRKNKKENRLSVIMLLTDGRPTIIPPKGEIHELQKYVDLHDFSLQINTFGFGYDLDSELLHSLAVFGSGTFAFIPDSKIVGTTFVNSISNVLSTVSTQTTLHLTPQNGASFVDQSWGSYKEQDESWGRIVNFGPITSGGTRYISVPMKLPQDENMPYLECILSCAELGSKKEKKKNAITAIGRRRKAAADLVAGHLTAKAVSIGLQATDLCIRRKGNAALKLLRTFKEELKAAAEAASKDDTDDFNQMSANSRTEALSADICGRLSKAFRGQPRFNRWGKHYLRALLRAHQLCLCTNFMDPGLQVNGGDLFRELRAKGDEVFVNLAAPKPSRRIGNNNSFAVQQNIEPNNNYQAAANRGYSYQQQQIPVREPTPPRVDMRDYYGGGGGGCFAPFCCVFVLNKGETKVCDVRVGDLVEVVDGVACVRFVVELKRDKRKRMIGFEGGLVVTGGHPIKEGDKWGRARDSLQGKRTEGCESVYTFVLDKCHVLIVNGMQCVTWANGVKDDCVYHEFYATQKVIHALEEKGKRKSSDGTHLLLKNVIAVYR